MEKYPIWMQGKTWMSKDDCQGVVQLMDSGFSFVDALNLLMTKKNSELFLKIIQELKLGQDMISVIKAYCPKDYRDDFYSLISFLPLKDSLKLCVWLHEEESKEKKELRKNLGYPLLMFVSTIVGLYFFVQICFPLLIQLMNDFNANSMYLQNIRLIFLVVLKSIMILMSATGLLIFMMSRKKNQVQAYCLIIKILNLSLLKQHISCQFARYFYHCNHVGCKTKETIEILKQVERKPIVNFLSVTVEESLLSGNEMKEAIQNRFMDESLHRFMTIAMHSSSMDEMLQGYIELSQKKMKQKIRLVTKLLQLFSYAIIALILIFVYQILILPLSVMSQL